MEIDLQNREQIQELREKVGEMSKTKELNEGWQRVYLRLSDALNELDAFIARSEI